MDSIENAAEERIRDHLTKVFEKKKGQEVEEVRETLERERTISSSVHLELHEDNRRKESLLNEILPKSVADRLLKGEPVATETYDAVTVFFSDIVGESLFFLCQFNPGFQVLQIFLHRALPWKLSPC